MKDVHSRCHREFVLGFFGVSGLHGLIQVGKPTTWRVVRARISFAFVRRPGNHSVSFAVAVALLDSFLKITLLFNKYLCCYSPHRRRKKHCTLVKLLELLETRSVLDVIHALDHKVVLEKRGRDECARVDGFLE